MAVREKLPPGPHHQAPAPSAAPGALDVGAPPAPLAVGGDMPRGGREGGP